MFLGLAWYLSLRKTLVLPLTTQVALINLDLSTKHRRNACGYDLFDLQKSKQDTFSFETGFWAMPLLEKSLKKGIASRFSIPIHQHGGENGLVDTHT